MLKLVAINIYSNVFNHLRIKTHVKCAHVFLVFFVLVNPFSSLALGMLIILCQARVIHLFQEKNPVFIFMLEKVKEWQFILELSEPERML